MNMADNPEASSTGHGRVGSWSRRPSGLKADDVDPTQAAIRPACEWSCVLGGADLGKGVMRVVIRHCRPMVVVIVWVVVGVIR